MLKMAIDRTRTKGHRLGLRNGRKPERSGHGKNVNLPPGVKCTQDRGPHSFPVLPALVLATGTASHAGRRMRESVICLTPESHSRGALETEASYLGGPEGLCRPIGGLLVGCGRWECLMDMVSQVLEPQGRIAEGIL